MLYARQKSSAETQLLHLAVPLIRRTPSCVLTNGDIVHRSPDIECHLRDIAYKLRATSQRSNGNPWFDDGLAWVDVIQQRSSYASESFEAGWMAESVRKRDLSSLSGRELGP